MKLSVKAFAITSGIVWGGGMLACGLINLAARPYGKRFLEVMSSVYPGFHNSRTLADVFVGAGYGFVDGAITGSVAAAVYNQFAHKGIQARNAQEPVPSIAGRVS